jgi:hypothetical protein
MKKITQLIVVLLMTVMLVAATPVSATGGPTSAPAAVTIYDSGPFQLQFVRKDTDGGPVYAFVGRVTMCDRIFDVRGLAVGNPADSTAIPGAPYSKVMEMVEDTCVSESFVYTMHGGALRALVEKPGNCVVFVRGAEIIGSFTLTPEGEAQLLSVILVPPRETI